MYFKGQTKYCLKYIKSNIETEISLVLTIVKHQWKGNYKKAGAALQTNYTSKHGQLEGIKRGSS